MRDLLPTVIDINKAFYPYSVGFESILNDLNKISKTVPTYPPYNIRKTTDNTYVIELAVAGFSKNDLEVTLEGNKLVVRGTSHDNPEASDFIFKGIADRNFTRTFTLSDKVEIKNAEMVNGMLKIWLESLLNTQNAIKKIAIKDQP